MSSAIRQQYVVLSVALHVAAVAALTLGIKFPTYQHAPAAAAPIQGMMIDAKVLQQETERRERVAREAVERKQRQERQAREAADAARRAEAEKQAAAKREQERLAAEQAAKEQAAKEAREKAEAAKREQERLAKEEAAKKAAAAKAAAAARQQKQLEADLQQQLAQEGERRRLEQSGLLDQYARTIENQIERNWIPPASAKTGLECVVNVVQIPSGDVVDVRVGRCNGDDAVVRSIEAAVRRASPLPKPPDPALFERNLVVTFKPDI